MPGLRENWRSFRLAIDYLDRGAEGFQCVATELGRDHRSTRHDAFHRRNIGAGLAHFVDQGDEHGRNTKNETCLFALNHFYDHGRIKHRCQQHRAAGSKPAQHKDRTTRRVEERHIVDETIPLPHARPGHGVDAIAHQAIVMQQRPFRETRGARRVLDLHRIAGLRIAQLAGLGLGPGIERLMIGEQDTMLDRGNFIANGVGNLLHGIAAEIRDIVNRFGSRLFEHIFQLALLIGRIDRHQDHTGKPTCQLEQNPFRNIVRINGNTGPFCVPTGERTGQALCIR